MNGAKCQCKGICHRYSTRKTRKYWGVMGSRRCRECETLYEKDVMERYGFSVLCPCCGSKTTTRSSGSRLHKEKIKANLAAMLHACCVQENRSNNII